MVAPALIVAVSLSLLIAGRVCLRTSDANSGSLVTKNKSDSLYFWGLMFTLVSGFGVASGALLFVDIGAGMI